MQNKYKLPWFQRARTYWIPIGVIFMIIASVIGINKLTHRIEICTVESSSSTMGTNGIAGGEISGIKIVNKDCPDISIGKSNWSKGESENQAKRLTPGKKYKFTIDTIQFNWIFHTWVGKDFEGPVQE
ncbi:murein peptide amidase A [Kocuria massiliensis]|uniref:murein peptide amidase A n=1 Tax=Kocuria massiliensis TaxID=1926282 RepID=UPI00117B491F|nr:murein peptide amidase A [Kocuria massiliensis]